MANLKYNEKAGGDIPDHTTRQLLPACFCKQAI